MTAALQGFHATEAEFPELTGFPTFSAAWYRTWFAAHLAAHPDCDVATRTSLLMLVDLAEQREAAEGAL